MQYLDIVQAEDEAAAAEHLELQQAQAADRAQNGSSTVVKQDSTLKTAQKSLRMGFRSVPQLLQGFPPTYISAEQLEDPSQNTSKGLHV